MLSISSLRRGLAAAAVALLVQVPAAGAQIATAAYAPTCGPGTACGTVRFTFTNPTATTSLLNTLTLTSSGVPFLFAPIGGGVATYEAVDAVGPFGGTGTTNAAGTQLFINFLTGAGFPFELGAGTTGYVEATLRTTTALPASGAFQFSATTATGAPLSGAFTSVTATPEPATFALVGGGLALVGLARRRRVARIA